MSRSPAPPPNETGSSAYAASAFALDTHPSPPSRLEETHQAHTGWGAGETPAEEAPPALASLAPHTYERWRRESRARALALGAHLPPGVFFSHRTAAALWRLPISPPHVHPERLDVAAFDGRPGAPRAGLASRSLSPFLAAVTTRHGVQLTDPATTWALLTPLLGRLEAIALGDAILYEPRSPGARVPSAPPLATRQDLHAALALPYRRDRPRLREIYADLSPKAASPSESHLRVLFRHWGFPPPHLDHDVWGDNGELLGRSAFAFPAHRVAVEYHPTRRDDGAPQSACVAERAQLYGANGWRLLRVTAELLYLRPTTLRGMVSDALDASSP